MGRRLPPVCRRTCSWRRFCRGIPRRGEIFATDWVECHPWEVSQIARHDTEVCGRCGKSDMAIERELAKRRVDTSPPPYLAGRFNRDGREEQTGCGGDSPFLLLLYLQESTAT